MLSYRLETPRPATLLDPRHGELSRDVTEKVMLPLWHVSPLSLAIILLYYCYRNERALMSSTKPRLVSAADRTAIVTKATLRAASQLGLTNKLLAAVIGVSEATVSRMRSGEYKLQRGQKSFELAVLFVRLYRSLDAIVGGDDTVAGSWLRNRNTVLG